MLLGPHSLLWYVLATLAALWAGWVLVRYVPFYRGLTADAGTHLPGKTAGRFDALDGLRGFLALAVVVHHACIARLHFVDLEWVEPDSVFYTAIGPIAVAMFFMVTGFLFWGKAWDSGGRVAPLRLLHNRVRRIAPLFLLLATIIAALAILRSDEWRGLPTGLTQYLASTAGLGLVFLPKLNNVHPDPLYQSMIWTLQYEWQFYLALPLIGLLATPRRYWGIVIVGLAVTYWLDDALYLNFLGGIAAVHLLHYPAARRWLASPVVAAAALAWLVGVIVLASQFWVTTGSYRQYQAPAVLASFPLFLTVVAGTSYGGLLTWRPSRCLGHISYSVYLLHGSVLYICLWFISRRIALHEIPPWQYWLLASVLMTVVVGFSACTYRLVEWPFLHRSSARTRPAPAAAESALTQQPANPVTPSVVVVREN
ncbi:MAG: acyltransferase [Phycisphaeraceae bacterium]